VSAQSDLSALATYSASEASASESTTASIAATVKTGAEVKASFDYYASFAPSKPKLADLNLDNGTEWAATTLKNYAKANAKEWGADVIQNVASAYGYEGYIPDKIPTNEKEAAQALVHVGCAAFGAETGINPEIAEVTVEAVLDGKLDSNDCESIGATAGAIAGAALCQAYGIPAPIGAFLGGKIGGFIGGEVADIFGLTEKAYKEWLRKQKELAAKELGEYEKYCGQVREGYWSSFDTLVVAVEKRWEALELQIGSRFDVRFFGAAPFAIANYIDQHTDYPWQTYLGARSCGISCPDGVSVRNSSKEVLATLSAADRFALQLRCRDEMVRNTHLPAWTRVQWAAQKKAGSTVVPAITEGCTHTCLADFGCPYPDMQSAISHFPTAPGLYGSTRRTCSALRALGYVWYPPLGPDLFRSWGVVRTGNTQADYTAMMNALHAHDSEYRHVACTLPAATLAEIKDKKAHALWLGFLDAMVSAEKRKIQSLNGAAVRLIGDLAKTAAMVAVQQKITDANTKKSLHGLGALSSTSASSWINNGALVAGLGVLAYGTRRRG